MRRRKIGKIAFSFRYWYNKPRRGSLGCKNYFVILVGMIYAVAHIGMVLHKWRNNPWREEKD